MKFLDLNGLKHILKFVDRTVSVVSSNFQINSHGRRDIPFITNHQIISNDLSGDINVFNWFKGASEGGTLEIVSTGSLNGDLLGIDDMNTSIMYKMKVVTPGPPSLVKCDSLTLSYTIYARLIKLNGKLIVAEFVQNK
nr:MAG: hypothetical protein [Bacteriophage sp.]